MIRGREEEVKMGKVKEGKERGRKEGREGPCTHREISGS